MMMWRGCELEERGGGEIIYANWILRQGTVGAVQCFWRVSEVVSKQSVEDYDCRRFLVLRTSWRSGLGSGYPDHPGVPGRSYSDCHVDSQDLRSVSSRGAGHTRGNSAGLTDTVPSLWYDGAHSDHASKYLIKRSFITIA